MPVNDTAVALRAEIAAHFQPDPPVALGIAVSGGGDSVALLVLLADWAADGGPALRAVTVDHRLRPESAGEAAAVAETCARLGIPHDTLPWVEGWDGTGNLQEAAREARYRLMADWARGRGLADVALAHTADDQAETLLMRLAREAGLDGLSAMGDRVEHGVTFRRPALRITRAALRRVLTDRGIAWTEDPSNADPTFERVRARQVLDQLAPLGISATGLSAVAHHLAGARDALYACLREAAHDIVTFQSGDMLVARDGLARLHDELARRLLQAGLRWVAGPGHGARGVALGRLLDAARTGQGMTLQGALVTPERDRLRIAREHAAVAETSAAPGALWDGRWRVTGPDSTGVEIRALGPTGLQECPGWRETGLPAASLTASPAVWRGRRLVAAPLAGCPNGWEAALERPPDTLFSKLLSH
ncbi:tRNA lysidine(34) synthetase TilS [Roseovarius salinarum]|uniref:tRNA lysidine(34) synthetase TilS n=1 Tax=Roseovarius salinarum TaxID=1981892 RepID=UPI000C347CBF|nr:tRNA lysidine(34) synthetase TilS [Roseovarius salinarum]